jgi:hypothetical protein
MNVNSCNNSTPDILLVSPGPEIFNGFLNSARAWLTAPIILRVIVKFAIAYSCGDCDGRRS